MRKEYIGKDKDEKDKMTKKEHKKLLKMRAEIEERGPINKPIDFKVLREVTYEQQVLNGEISADSEDDPEQYECVVCFEIKPSPELCGNCYAIICTDCLPFLPECPECQDPR